MSDFSAEIQARLNLNGIKDDLAAIGKKSVTLSNINADTSGLIKQIQTALNSQSFNLSLGNVSMSNISNQMTRAGAVAGNQFTKSMASSLNKINVHSGGIKNVSNIMSSAGFNQASIKAATKGLDSMLVSVKKLSTREFDNGNIRMTISGIDDIGRAVQVVRDFNKESGQILETSKVFTQSFGNEMTASVKKFQSSLKIAKREFTNEKLLGKITDVKGQFADLGFTGNSRLPSIGNNIKQIDSLYESMGRALSLGDDDGIVRIYGELNEVLSKTKNNLGIVTKETAEFRKNFKLAASEIKSDSRSFEKEFGDARKAVSSNKISNQVSKVEDDYKRLSGLSDLRLPNIKDNIDRLHSVQELMSNPISSPEQVVAGYKEFKSVLASVENSLKIVNRENADVLKNQAREATTSSSITKKYKTDLENAIASVEAGDLKANLHLMENKFKSLSNTGHENLFKIKNDLKELGSLRDELESGDSSSPGYLKKYTKFNQILKRVKNDLRIVADDSKTLISDVQLSSFNNNIASWLSKNTKATGAYGAQIDNLIGKIRALQESGNATKGDFLGIQQEWNAIKQEAIATGNVGMTFGDQFKKSFSTVMKYASASNIIFQTIRAFKDMYQNVKSVDTAMTELKKVSNESDATYSKFLKGAGKAAKEIGTTMDGLVNSTADFARLGYSFGESQELAKVANIYAVVGDEIEGVDDATKSIISTMTAFDVEATDSISIVDKFNEVGKFMPKDTVMYWGIPLLVAISVKNQRWSRPRKDLIFI